MEQEQPSSEPLLPKQIDSLGDMRGLVRWCIAKLRLGYHPDTPASDYVSEDGSRFFTDAQARIIDDLHNQAFDHAESDMIYEYGLEEMRGLLDLSEEERE